MELRNCVYLQCDYTTFFYATMCHVCKRFGDGVPLKRCSSCRMIAYCGREHQKQHWKQHKPLCKAIQDVLQEYNCNDRYIDSEVHDKMKLIFTRLVSCKLGRHLNVGEIQMFIFPKECLICHEKNDKLLEDCQKCAASFCKNHKDDTEHGDICAFLELGLRSDLLAMTEFTEFSNSLEPLSDLKRVPDASTFQNMKDFVNALENIQTDSKIPYDILAAEYSQCLSRPLTVFYAMRLLNYVLKGKVLVIHVVDANYAEEATFLLWKVLLQLMETVMSVVVIMIGPGLKDKVDPSRTCKSFLLLENRTLFFEYQDVSYDNYVHSPSFEKPDLIVGFNLNIQEHELESNKEIWALSIHALAKQNCPVVLTFSKQRELEKGMNKMNTILGKKVDYLYSGKNPFASFRPHRDFGPEHVYYDNHSNITREKGRQLPVTVDDHSNGGDRVALASIQLPAFFGDSLKEMQSVFNRKITLIGDCDTGTIRLKF